MSSKIGWFTTGRDEEAVNLLKIIYNGIEDGSIEGKISYIFLNRDKGEGHFSDMIIDIARGWDIPLVCLSSSKFKPKLRAQARECKEAMAQWREEYHLRVLYILSGYEADFSVLAGYMLIVGTSMCKELRLINLHPAPPHGPAGTWQEVIWQLIGMRANHSGVTIHKVTPELDQGPPITYCLYKIKDGKFSVLWQELDERLKHMDLKQIIGQEGEKNPLFQMIRQEGVKRERPLIFETIRGLSSGTLEIKGQMVYFYGKMYQDGVCLSEEVERIVNKY